VDAIETAEGKHRRVEAPADPRQMTEEQHVFNRRDLAAGICLRATASGAGRRPQARATR